MELFFWITDLLIPAIVLLIGIVFTRRPPKKINPVYGYRTRRSTNSQEAWDKAHALYGRLCLYTGPSAALIIIITKLAVPLEPEYLSLINMATGIAAIFAPLPYVEKRLK